ncbi:MAG: histidine phosphatase family protein [Pseudonocardiales bacterium]|nr:histidine phosphatase family protein [Pseudonocardiales bacterium]MBV9729765.1 histidine phosphatase family protein [Pseudonocardiales bacterium]
MSRTVVHLLRHGDVHNPDGVLYGRLPGFWLSDVGVRQAERVAAHLADHDVVHVVASPLLRAQQTATPITARHGLDLVTDEGLIEAGNVFEGTRVSVVRDLRNWPALRNPFRPSWGEPYREIAARMLAAVHRARERATGHEAVCVSHQLPICALVRHLAGQRLWHDPRRRRCSLASLTSLVFADEALVEVVYSQPVVTRP